MSTTRLARRCGAAVAALLVVTLLPAEPASAAPPVTVRVPHVAEPGQVPPAVVAGGAPGDGYVVRTVAGSQVASGTLAAVDGPPAPWATAALADLSSLGPGSYVVESDGVVSEPFTVSGGAYAGVLDSLLGIFDANADGNEPSTYHAPSHLNDARSKIRNGPHQGERVDVRGGWMDAGDQLKFTTTISYASVMLEYAARNQPSMADQLTATSDVGIRWLVKAHPRSGVFVSMVGDEQADHDTGWRDPAADDASANPLLAHRPSEVLTPATGGSDVAGSTAAALALAADRSSGTRRATLVSQAKAWLAYAWKLGDVWRNCCYPGGSWRDDVALADAALWRVTGDAGYATKALRQLKQVTADGYDSWQITADGYEMAGVAAADLCGVLGAPGAPAAVSGPACRILRSGGAHWAYVAGTETAFDRTGDNVWGSARESEAGALTAVLAGRAGSAESGPAALRGLGWFLGVNPWGRRWQVGFGTENPHHWLRGLGQVGVPVGAVPGGPTSVQQYAGQVWITRHPGPYDTDQQYYGDYRDDYVSNEIGIDYNAPAVLHFALVSPG